MEISISSLPVSVQKLLPLSIRTFKDTYEIEDLPPTIRNIIEDYLQNINNIVYSSVFDTTPQVSEYGDGSSDVTPSTDAGEPDDNTSDATVITLDAAYDRYLTSEDEDWYKITIP